MIWRILLLFVGVFACSTAVIMIKASTEQPVLLAAERLLIAAVLLLPVYLRDRRLHRAAYTRRHLLLAVVPGLVLGIHFITWVIGARMAPAANASLIVNLVPIAMPFFLIFLVKESLNRQEILATGLALCGLLILGAGDFNVSRTYFWGDVLCFGSMLFFTLYLALGRRNRDFPTIWLYVVPLYFVAGLFCLVVSLPFAGAFKRVSRWNLLMAFGLAVIPTIMGHSILNYSLKHLRGQLVSILNMAQFVFAGTMAWLIWQERPAWTFIPASALLVASAWVVIRSHRAGERRADRRTKQIGDG